MPAMCPGSRAWPIIARTLVTLAVLIVLAATLLPSEPEGEIRWSRVFCVLCGPAALADGFANIVLFLPVGVGLAVQGRRRPQALLFAAALSLSVELAQFVIPGRDPNLGDVIFNVLGAALGGEVVRWAPQWSAPSPRAASRLSLGAALIVAIVFGLTDALLAPSLPDGRYLSGSPALQGSTTPLRLGGNIEPGSHFKGRIDDVRVYRTARTAQEIRDDMERAVTRTPGTPDLVAAYGFDEGVGTVVSDASGHGNTGSIVGASWSSEGRHGGALEFDGLHDAVVIPHAPSLDLRTTMTLEAWIHPTGSQRGWRAIVQKEFDIYFLAASSEAGPRRPGAGGTFAASTESVVAPKTVPLHAWTHLALAYDGAALNFYVNGSLAARRLRWYPGHVVAVSLDDFGIRAGSAIDSRRLRDGILAGAPLRVHTVAVAPVPTPVPLVVVRDQVRHEILSLHAERDDLLYHVRTRAAAAELDSPAIRAAGALRGIGPGEDVMITISRKPHGYCFDVNGRGRCGLGFTLGMGWGLFAYSQIPAGWLHGAMNAVWVAALLFPVGLWSRHRWESGVAMVVLAAGIMLPLTIGNLTTSMLEIVASLGGIAAGLVTSHIATAAVEARPRAG